jgi:hypothetical protein
VSVPDGGSWKLALGLAKAEGHHAAAPCGTELGRTPIRALLHMASGIDFHLVLVHTAVRLKPTHNVGDSELLALWHSVLEHAETN